MSKPVPRLKLSFPLSTLFTALLARRRKRENVKEFEKAFAQYIGVRHAIFVSSGRAALYMILKHSHLKPGDEVLVPAFTFFAVPQVVKALKLKPVFVDVNPRDCSLDIKDAASRVTPRTRAIIPTHLFGIAADLDAVISFARRHSLMVVEDCAQGCGGEVNGRKLGSFGDAGYFSFSLTKNITCLGGGMITTDRDTLAAKIRKDMERRGVVPSVSLISNALKIIMMKMSVLSILYRPMVYPLVSRLGRKGKDLINDLFHENEDPETKPEVIDSSVKRPRPLQARIGLQQLDSVDSINSARRAHGRFLLQDLPRRGVCLQWDPGDKPGHIFMSFIVLPADREAVRKKLWEMGIDTSIGFMSFCPLIFAPETGSKYPSAEWIAGHIIHVPVYPRLREKDLWKVAGALAACLKDDLAQLPMEGTDEK